jgi:hypothetical protein
VEPEITELTPIHERAYEELLQVCPCAMLYHSLAYKRFLNDFLPSTTEEHYLLAYVDGQIAGALPCFLALGPFGPVVNSLPFFGSHGGLLLRPSASPEVAVALLDALLHLCRVRDVFAATVIDTPYLESKELFRRGIAFQYSDQRIGQLTDLPDRGTIEQTVEKLLALYHQKTRNIVRKALRNGLLYSHDQSTEALVALHRLHEVNILGIGGIAKPWHFFTSIATQLQYDVDYRIYTARTPEGAVVCALMLLYFKDTVEYFVPATDEKWRSHQPLSALIHLAMLDAVTERGSRRWNWGGTWVTQKGVYHFKSRWGTSDHPYSYYTRVFSGMRSLIGVKSSDLSEGYPWFYTIPYSSLEQR